MVTQSVCITLPKDLLETLDDARGDVARSRYIAKMLRTSLEGRFSSLKEEKNAPARINR
jgi:metal-responsive CopG/Arc/MetJ family transcriptional regulator